MKAKGRLKVPEGRMKVAQDVSPGEKTATLPSPVGTFETKIKGGASNVPTGLGAIIAWYPGLSSWATLIRPSGTCPKTPLSTLHSPPSTLQPTA